MLYIIKENEMLIARTCPVMPMLEGKGIEIKNENAFRTKTNKETKAKFDKLVSDGLAVKVSKLPKHPLNTYTIVNGKLKLDNAKRKKANNQKQRDKRVLSYPEASDQLDAIIKWLATDTSLNLPQELQDIIDQCMKVKEDNPLES